MSMAYSFSNNRCKWTVLIQHSVYKQNLQNKADKRHNSSTQAGFDWLEKNDL